MLINNQKGSILIEGLISILIFSFGLLGVAGYQTAMVKQTSNIQYRLQASLLVSSAMGEMEAIPAQVGCYTGGVCDDLTNAHAWLTKVAKMPGAVAHPPTVSTNVNGVTTIVVFWALPKEKDLSGAAVVHSISAQFASLVLPS